MKKLLILAALVLLPFVAGAQTERVRRRTDTNQSQQQQNSGSNANSRNNSNRNSNQNRRQHQQQQRQQQQQQNNNSGSQARPSTPAAQQPAQTSLCPDGNHPHVIDLGLPSGTKWSCCNVGSQKPEDYGNYYAWGETSTKSNYDWCTYRWCNGSYNTQTKYNVNSGYGTVDNRTQLDLSDDAARAAWGGSWRMPTLAECQELIDGTTSTWTTVNGINGRRFTSKSNGRSVFLPAAGWRNGTSLNGRGENGICWSSSLSESSPSYARYLNFNSGGVYAYSNSRCIGHGVRPVLRN